MNAKHTGTEAPVLSSADFLVHLHHRGQNDECALISMEPGEYPVSESEGIGLRYSKLTVLAGSLELNEAGQKYHLDAGQTTSLKRVPFSLATNEFTQAELMDATATPTSADTRSATPTPSGGPIRPRSTE